MSVVLVQIVLRGPQHSWSDRPRDPSHSGEPHQLRGTGPPTTCAAAKASPLLVALAIIPRQPLV